MMSMPQMMPRFAGQPMMAGQQYPGIAQFPQGGPQFQPQALPMAQQQHPQMQPRQQMPSTAALATFPSQQQPMQWSGAQPKQQMAPPQSFANASAPVTPVQPAIRTQPETPRFASMEASDPPATIRLQSAEENAPAARPMLTLPTPEKLGIGGTGFAPASASASTVDWNDVHARLKQMGAISFQLHRSATNYRVVFVLASRGDGQPRFVETEGSTEAEAVQAALRRADNN